MIVSERNHPLQKTDSFEVLELTKYYKARQWPNSKDLQSLGLCGPFRLVSLLVCAFVVASVAAMNSNPEDVITLSQSGLPEFIKCLGKRVDLYRCAVSEAGGIDVFPFNRPYLDLKGLDKRLFECWKNVTEIYSIRLTSKGGYPDYWSSEDDDVWAVFEPPTLAFEPLSDDNYSDQGECLKATKRSLSGNHYRRNSTDFFEIYRIDEVQSGMTKWIPVAHLFSGIHDVISRELGVIVLGTDHAGHSVNCHRVSNLD